MYEIKSGLRKPILPSATITLALLVPVQTPANSEVTLGTLPYVNSSQLVRHHQSLKQYLQERLGRQVSVGSTPDFPAFVTATREGRFDLVLTAPHLGRLAQVESRYRPVAQTDHHVQAFYVTRKDSGINNLAELKNKTVSMMPSHALIVRMVEKQLKEIGLEDGKNITFKRTHTHNNALFAALHHESDAAVTGILIWRSLNPEFKSAMRVLAASDTGPGLFLMAHPRWSEPDLNRLREIILEFSASPLSRNYLHNRYIGLNEETLQRMDPYLPTIIYEMNRRHVEKN